MKKITILILLLVSFSFVSEAQMNFGVKAGLNLATVSGDDVVNAEIKPGYQVGLATNFSMGEAFSIQPGLILSGKGTGNSEIDDYSLNTNYLEIPINAVYNVSGFQIFAGPYLGFGLFGKLKGLENDVDIEFTNDVDSEEFNIENMEKVYQNSLDYGLNFGAGYMITETIQVQAAYGLGLGNNHPKVDGEEPNDKISNSVIQLNVSYFF